MRTGIFTILLLALFLAGGFALNPSGILGTFSPQPQMVLAQEDIEPFLQCSGPEIPVGKVREETDKFSQEIVRLMLQLAQDAKAERSAAKKLMATSDECKIDRCLSSCVWETNIITKERFCAIGGCGGDACPKQDVEDRLRGVEDAYAQLRATRQALSNLLHGSQRDQILLNLEEARNGLQECVTPANFYDTAESNQEVDILISCQEARLNGVLSEKQAQCFDNNFFCCTIKPTQ